MGDILYILILFGPYSLVFILIHVVTVLNRVGVKWNKFDSLVLAWAFAYLFFAPMLMGWSGLMASAAGGPALVFGISELVLFIGPPGLISAVLLRFAWGSNWIFLCVLIGTVCAIGAGFLGMLGVMIVAPIIWNGAYIVGCVLANSKYGAFTDPNACRHCRYSLIGLPDETPCPECNTPSPPIDGAG